MRGLKAIAQKLGGGGEGRGETGVREGCGTAPQSGRTGQAELVRQDHIVSQPVIVAAVLSSSAVTSAGLMRCNKPYTMEIR